MRGACCPRRAKVTMLDIGGHSVGVSRLDEIMEEVSSLKGGIEEELKTTLLKMFKIHNHVPPGAETEYNETIWREFLTRRKGGTQGRE